MLQLCECLECLRVEPFQQGNPGRSERKGTLENDDNLQMVCVDQNDPLRIPVIVGALKEATPDQKSPIGRDFNNELIAKCRNSSNTRQPRVEVTNGDNIPSRHSNERSAMRRRHERAGRHAQKQQERKARREERRKRSSVLDKVETITGEHSPSVKAIAATGKMNDVKSLQRQRRSVKSSGRCFENPPLVLPFVNNASQEHKGQVGGTTSPVAIAPPIESEEPASTAAVCPEERQPEKPAGDSEIAHDNAPWQTQKAPGDIQKSTPRTTPRSVQSPRSGQESAREAATAKATSAAAGKPSRRGFQRCRERKGVESPPVATEALATEVEDLKRQMKKHPVVQFLLENPKVIFRNEVLSATELKERSTSATNIARNWFPEAAEGLSVVLLSSSRKQVTLLLDSRLENVILRGPNRSISWNVRSIRNVFSWREILTTSTTAALVMSMNIHLMKENERRALILIEFVDNRLFLSRVWIMEANEGKAAHTCLCLKLLTEYQKSVQ